MWRAAGGAIPELIFVVSPPLTTDIATNGDETYLEIVFPDENQELKIFIPHIHALDFQSQYK